eukprot:scaffold35931_cov21-Tisochrysis_lutea.AAC.1
MPTWPPCLERLHQPWRSCRREFSFSSLRPYRPSCQSCRCRTGLEEQPSGGGLWDGWRRGEIARRRRGGGGGGEGGERERACRERGGGVRSASEAKVDPP